VQSPSRRDLNKLVDPAAAVALAERVDLFARVPFEPGLGIDTTLLEPGAVARQIRAHFGLPAATHAD
jgi:hypothetical protein